MDNESLFHEDAVSSRGASPADEQMVEPSVTDGVGAGALDDWAVPMAAGAESLRITGPRAPVEVSALEAWLARTGAADTVPGAETRDDHGAAGDQATADDQDLSSIRNHAVSGDEPATGEKLAQALETAGFPEHVVRHLCAVSTTLLAARADDGARGVRGGRATDDELVAAAEGLVVLQRWSDAALSSVLVDLSEATGEEMLARSDVASPDELSKTARERWRARTKSTLAHELQLLTGWGLQDCHDRVGFALAPRQSASIPLAALASGESDWRQVRTWWQACWRMPVEIAAQVAARMFGPDSDRARSARDSGIAPEHQARASLGETKDTLARLIAALLGEDPKAAREAREAAVARRDAYAELEDDGTGRFNVIAGTSSVVAAMDRVDRVARAVKAAGDPRTLAQLRADIAMSLLIHGTTMPPGAESAAVRAAAAAADGTCSPTPTPTSPSTAEVEGEAQTRPDAASGTQSDAPTGPRSDAPTGHQSDAATVPRSDAATGPPPDAAAATMGRARGSDPPDPGSGSRRRTGADDKVGRTGRKDPVQYDLLGEVDESIARVLTGQPSASLEVIVPLDVLLNSESTGVGAMPGHGHLSAEHVRQLAAQCGGVIHRLVTDPMDGRVVERSITAYRPDAKMRAQILAADVFCRAPGCRVPARKCQLDHETPYIDGVSGGATSEVNLNGKHDPHHQLKTWDIWRTTMDETRRVTWVTLFGRCYVTRAHDYRVYDGPRTSRAASREVSGLSDAAGDQDLQDRLIYAALAFRDPGGRLAGDDDYADNDLVDESARSLHRRAPIQLRHRAPGPRGRRRGGPPPGQLTPEEILAELGADAESQRPEGARPFDDPVDGPPPF